MSRGTLVLLLLVAGLGGYTYFFEIKGKEQEKIAKEQNSLLFKWKVDDISAFKMIFGDAVKVEGQKIENKWQLSFPWADLGDETAIADLLSTLLNEKAKSTVKEGDGIDWASYGLEKPIGKISLKSGQGDKAEEKTIEIGSKNNFEGNPYLRLTGENRVLLGSSIWNEIFGRTALSLRDRRIFRDGIANVERIEVRPRNSAEAFSMSYKEANWSLDGKDWQIDQNAVRAFLTQISELRALEVAKEIAPEKLTELKEYGLHNPDSTLIFGMKDNKTWTSSWAMAKAPSAYVMASDPHRVFKIEGVGANMTLKLTRESFRNRAEPFHFVRDDVKKISLTTKLKSTVFTIKDNMWVVDGLSDKMKVDQDNVASLIIMVNSLKVADFSNQGLSLAASKEKLSNQIQFFDASDKIIFAMNWAETAKAKRVPVKTTLYPEVVGVDEGQILALPLHDLVIEQNSNLELNQKKKKGE